MNRGNPEVRKTETCSTRRINEILEWPAEGGHKTTSGLFLSLLAREPRIYSENSVLTKPHEASHNASLPLNLHQSSFCLPTRALEVLAHRCHPIAKLQAAPIRNSMLAPLSYGAPLRTETTGEILPPLRLLICTAFVQKKIGRIYTKSNFFTPYSFFYTSKVQNVPFLLEPWADYFLLWVPCLHSVNRVRWPKQSSFWKDSPGH